MLHQVGQYDWFAKRRLAKCWPAVGLAVCVAATAHGQSPSATPSGLSLEQQQLASRYERLELVALRLAEVVASREPERAEQLRRTIQASRQRGVAERFESIVQLLKAEQLAAAASDQQILHMELGRLLQLLLEDPRQREREARQRWLKEQIRVLGKLIRQQRSLRAQNRDGADADQIADRQQQLGESTEKLQQEVESVDGQPQQGQPQQGQPQQGQPQQGQPQQGQPQQGQPQQGQPQQGQPQQGQPQQGQPQQGQPQQGQPQQGQPQQGQPQQGQPQQGQPQQGQPQTSDPMQRAAQRAQAARQAMRQAEEQLRQAKREGSIEQQTQALRNLEAARAELQRILRQLREEEQEQLLTQLAARFREMLSEQRAIYEETVEISNTSPASGPRERMLRAIRLSRREAELVDDAEKALVLLREDGTSVAFPETVEQLRDDMQTVAARLAAVEVGPITQTVELDLVAGLQDLVGALERARDELAQQRGQPMSAGGAPQDQALVSQLAELRMIRTLQARIYQRTQDLATLQENRQVEGEDLRAALETLAQRQQRVWQATQDLDRGENR